MPAIDSPRQLLDAVYSDLGFDRGDLLDASEKPNSNNSKDWVEKGEWLALASRVGAEKVFFVDNNPVIVFAKEDADLPSQWLKVFNRVWCMARPQMLFFARPGELSVYNLTQQPTKDRQEAARKDRLLGVVDKVVDVQVKLKRYRRDKIESGRLFEDDARFAFHNRADHALVRDLGAVRQSLLDLNLKVEHAHSLIGRSIFIRYLEDRKVLLPSYFQEVAEKHKAWEHLLESGPTAVVEELDEDPLYLKVLSNKRFTYALFRKLATDFHGDMFPITKDEEEQVRAEHLEKLRDFLTGSAGSQLFFFAYKFDIIPIELISSIYEEFYTVQTGKKPADGSYYTPSALVEFVLSHVLSKEVLESRPRVFDPACGSGIFLVEAFRRLVRHRVSQLGRRLRPDELRKILRDQIAGIDINPEAVRVAAFSLYLSLLHYQEPPDILYKELPSLTYTKNRTETDPALNFDILLASDAFHVEDKVDDETVLKRFSSGSATVVVGNPPWGDPTSKDELVKAGKKGALAWCTKHKKAVGNKELSQAFVHKTMDLLKDGGWAGMLLSTGVFFKRNPPSRMFRTQWLPNAALKQVVNFAAVRDTFFTGPGHKKRAIAPFVSVIFQKREPEKALRFAYWSAKKTGFIERVQAVILNRADLRVLRQQSVQDNDELWKVYWWGGHRDEALINSLKTEGTLKEAVSPNADVLRVGYKDAIKDNPADWLANYEVLPNDFFYRYGPLPVDSLEPVGDRVHRRGSEACYKDLRLLIGRGISQSTHPKGMVIARLESDPFYFRDSIYGLPLGKKDETEGKVLLGILWSSLTRYFLFMTSNTWGMWHHDLKKPAIYSIPVRIPRDKRVRSKIAEIVEKLRSYVPRGIDLFSMNGQADGDDSEPQESDTELEARLDDAIFELYELSEAERDLVRDMCKVGLEHFYGGRNSAAVQPVIVSSGNISLGRLADLPKRRSARSEMDAYIDAFLSIWEPELQNIGGRFRWRVIRPDGDSPMLAAIFSTETPSEPLPKPTGTAEQAWHDALHRLGEAALQPFEARRIYIDGITRIVTDTDIVIIKRNEKRLWTRSAAREDAEATILQTMRKQMIHSGQGVASGPA